MLHRSVIPDVNECQTASRGGCTQKCINTLGTYKCECNTGYTINIDQRTCDGKYHVNIDHMTCDGKYHVNIDQGIYDGGADRFICVIENNVAVVLEGLPPP